MYCQMRLSLAAGEEDNVLLILRTFCYDVNSFVGQQKGCTPLNLACEVRKTFTALTLIQFGCDLNIPDKVRPTTTFNCVLYLIICIGPWCYSPASDIFAQVCDVGPTRHRGCMKKFHFLCATFCKCVHTVLFSNFLHHTLARYCESVLKATKQVNGKG